MPSASDYTSFLKNKSIAVTRKWGDVVPRPLLNSQVRATQMSKLVTPGISVLVPPVLKTGQAYRVNHPWARSQINW